MNVGNPPAVHADASQVPKIDARSILRDNFLAGKKSCGQMNVG